MVPFPDEYEMSGPTRGETDLVRERYDRRSAAGVHAKYGALLPHSVCFRQEKERGLVRLFRRLERDLGPVQSLRVLEIGCGNGANLVGLLRLGFQPENLVGVELLEDRARDARRVLPEATQVHVGSVVPWGWRLPDVQWVHLPVGRPPNRPAMSAAEFNSVVERRGGPTIFARASGLPRQTVWRYRTGRRPIPDVVARVIRCMP